MFRQQFLGEHEERLRILHEKVKLKDSLRIRQIVFAKIVIESTGRRTKVWNTCG